MCIRDSNVADAATWALVGELNLTGTFNTTDVFAPPGPVTFYRAFELPGALAAFGLTLRHEGTDLLLEWPADCTGCVLEQKNALVPPSEWSPASGAAQLVNCLLYTSDAADERSS